MTLDRIEALSNEQIASHASDSSILGATNENVKSLEAMVEASNSSTRQVLEQRGDKVQDLSGLSSEQSETLNSTCNAILHLLKQHVSDKPYLSVENDSRKASTMSHHDKDILGETCDPLDKDEGRMQECLDRLCQLAEETEKSMYSEDAETIIDDLQALLDTLSKAEEQSAKDRNGKRRRKSYEDDNGDEILRHQREFKRMRSLLTSSQCIALNGKGDQAVFFLALNEQSNLNTSLFSASTTARQNGRVQVNEVAISNPSFKRYYNGPNVSEASDHSQPSKRLR